MMGLGGFPAGHPAVAGHGRVCTEPWRPTAPPGNAICCWYAAPASPTGWRAAETASPPTPRWCIWTSTTRNSIKTSRPPSGWPAILQQTPGRPGRARTAAGGSHALGGRGRTALRREPAAAPAIPMAIPDPLAILQTLRRLTAGRHHRRHRCGPAPDVGGPAFPVYAAPHTC